MLIKIKYCKQKCVAIIKKTMSLEEYIYIVDFLIETLTALK